jgi:hypothetical protein
MQYSKIHSDSALERVKHVALNEGIARYEGAIVGAYQGDVKVQLVFRRFSRMGVDIVFVLSN